MVKSELIYSPQHFVEALTGKCYIFGIGDVVVEISNMLSANGYGYLWDYPLSEIDEIVENDINVVLVDVSGYNNGDDEWITEYRWFEVPANFRGD